MDCGVFTHNVHHLNSNLFHHPPTHPFSSHHPPTHPFSSHSPSPTPLPLPLPFPFIHTPSLSILSQSPPGCPMTNTTHLAKAPITRFPPPQHLLRLAIIAIIAQGLYSELSSVINCNKCSTLFPQFPQFVCAAFKWYYCPSIPINVYIAFYGLPHGIN
jgi:hypothetical protein